MHTNECWKFYISLCNYISVLIGWNTERAWIIKIHVFFLFFITYLMKLKPIYNFEMAHKYPLSIAIIYWILWQSVEYWTESMRISLSDITSITWISRSQVIRNLKILEKEWLIKRQRVENDKNIYSVVNAYKYPCW